MYAAERKQEILELIREKSRVSVAVLAGQFGVSRATIRRDLSELDGSGLLERTYGGALKADLIGGEAAYAQRSMKEREYVP